MGNPLCDFISKLYTNIDFFLIILNAKTQNFD